MAREDEAAELLSFALVQVDELPRATVRKEILNNALLWIEKALKREPKQ